MEINEDDIVIHKNGNHYYVERVDKVYNVDDK